MATKKNSPKKPIIYVDESGMEHSMWSPSNAHRWIKCSGSVIESIGVKKKPAGKPAQEGTKAHKFGEQVLLGEIELEEIEDDEMREGVSVYNAACEEIFNEFNNPGFAVESSIDLSSIIPRNAPEEWTCFGNADCIIWDEDNKEPPVIIDFKYGRKLVEVCNNDQLMLYAYGVVQDLEYDGPHVRVVIVQPRAAHKDGPVRECVVSLKQLEAHAKTCTGAINRGTDEEPYKGAGDWCMYCVLQPRCQTAMRMTQEVAAIDFDDDAFNPVPVDQMTDLQIATVIKYKKAIENWMNEVYDEALPRARGGHEYPHMKLVRNSGRASFKSEEAFEQMVEDLELTDDEAYSYKSKGIGDIEKVLKGYYDENPRELLADYINKSEGSIALVPDTDGRIEYNPAKSEFDDESGE